MSGLTYKMDGIKPDVRGTPKAEDLHAELNKLGEQGCELVSALRTSLVEPTRRYPKRRKA